jgi:hypothetical protein
MTYVEKIKVFELQTDVKLVLYMIDKSCFLLLEK